MSSGRHQRLADLFVAAMELAPDERGAFLDRMCAGDPELREELERLLAAHTEGDTSESILAALAPPARDLAAGAVVGGAYRVEEPLGRGGMGAVYRATQLATGREVALKILARAPNAAGRERFRREALTLARLSHPNVVAVYDFGACEAAGDFIAMELVSGRSLHDEVRRRGRLPAAEAVRVLGEVCSGVEAAHEAGVIHRDIKPANVMLEEGGVAKVLDFGVARPVEGAEALTATGTLVGTPLYMAPELCEGRESDERSDIYALGCLAYEALAGTPPFDAKSLAGLLVKHVSQAPEAPSAAGAEAGPALDAAILKALAKDPADRYPSAGAMSRALSEALEGRAPSPTPAPAARNLPREVSSFVGRGDEAKDVARLVAASPLVTLTGPGGIGKTRLAVRVAGGLADAGGEGVADGVWLADLAPLADGSLVAPAVAGALGVRDEPGRDLTALLCEKVKGRRTLLLLDNCEHVLAACAALASALLGAAPGVRVLATSREALGVDGERVVAVGGLSLEAGGALSDAGLLFEERARLARPSFAVTAETAPSVEAVCRTLEGIPLAIELAAARVRVLSVAQILARLGERFRLLTGGGRSAGRQQTLRAAIDWSHDLLSEEERALLRRLSVFAGGWTLSAAEEVVSCQLSVVSSEGIRGQGPGAREESRIAADGAAAPSSLTTDNWQLTTDNCLDLLSRLVDKSLISSAGGGARYGMLETIREYAGERLREAGEEGELRDRHAAWCERTVAHAQGQNLSGNQADWIALLDLEFDNVREAMRWTLRGEGDPASGLRTSTQICLYCMVRWRVTEGIEWLGEALALAPDAPTSELAEALFALGTLKGTASDFAGAFAFHERGLAVRRALGDERQVARALCAAANALIELGDARAIGRLEEALAIYRRLDVPRGVGQVLQGLGNIAMDEGRFGDADGLLSEALSTALVAGDKHSAVIQLLNLAECSLALGAVDTAAERVEEGLRLGDELDFKNAVVHLRLLRGLCAGARGDLDGAWAAIEEALAENLRLGHPGGVLRSLVEMATLAARRGEWRRALRLAGAAEGCRAAHGLPPPPPFEARRFAGVLRPAREALGPEAAERAFADGLAASPERAAAPDGPEGEPEPGRGPN